VHVIQITIRSLAYGGDAIGKLPDGRTAFVRGGCPGDVVLAEITEERPRYVRGHVTQIIEPSPDRVDAPCPYFGTCGGCSWQHVAYSAQLGAKRRSIVDALTRIGGLIGIEELVGETVPSRNEYGYRNKIELVVDPTSSRPRLGYHKQASEEVVPVDQCLLLPKKLLMAPKALTGALRYVAGDSDLGLNRVALRTGSHTRILRSPSGPSRPVSPSGGRSLRSDRRSPSSIVRVLANHRPGDAPSQRRGPQRSRTLAGGMAGFSFAVSAPSFFQTNTMRARSSSGQSWMRSKSAARSRSRSVRRCRHVHASARRGGAEVVAVEASGSAVRDLRRNLDSTSLAPK
jgi:23S rRNA (uracil1939-C5)-methyltransferase